MKIGIITFHHGYNFGGFLQVFCLQETLKKLGHDVEIVNYQNPTHFIRKHKNLIKLKSPSATIGNLLKAYKFNKIHRKLAVSKRTFGKELNSLRYDYLITGSDEVWNFNNPMFGKDLVYFGKGINAKRKISYAASFGAVNSDLLISNTDIIEELKNFDNISVRDLNSEKAILSVGLKPTIVWDPTFLYDVKPFIVNPINEDKYILIYVGGVLDQSFLEYARKFAKDKALRLISIGYKQSFCDKHVTNLNPFEWLGYLKNAEFVFTSMFHGTIFSILLKKQFLTSFTEYRKNKFLPMLDTLGLQNRIYKKEMEELENIDYKHVFNVITQGKENSLSFLKNALKEI